MSETLVNVTDAAANLAALVARVLQGEDVVITRSNRPLVRLVPVVGEPGPKTLGRSRGKVRVSDDFDAPLDRASWHAGA